MTHLKTPFNGGKIMERLYMLYLTLVSLIAALCMFAGCTPLY